MLSSPPSLLTSTSQNASKDFSQPYEPVEVDEDDFAARDFEDNMRTPSRFAMQYLRGRCLSESTIQDFSAEWIFQRALNKMMQLKPSSEEQVNWYFVHVDGQSLEQPFPAGVVILIVTLLSPLLFPLIFGAALLALTIFAPITFYHLRSFERHTLYRASPQNEKTADKDGEWPPSKKLLVRRSGSNSRYSWTSILTAAGQSAFYCACGTLPWLFLMSGRYACAIDIDCKDTTSHTSPIVAFGPWLACGIAAFRWGNSLHASACDCACEIANGEMLRDKTYGEAMHMTIKKLASDKDKWSFWPKFVMSEIEEPEDDQPFTNPLSLSWICLLLGPALHGLLPQLWISYKYQEQLPFHEDWLTMTVIWLGVIAPAIEIRSFFIRFFDAVLEFEDVVHQLVIFSYITSKRSLRMQDARRKVFERLVADNDKYRIERGSEKKHNPELLFESENGRFGNKSEQTPKSNRSFYHQNGQTEENVKDELEDLCLTQVSFNFSRKEGIMLYRKMRTWLSTDILNERSDIERFITISLQFSAAGAAVLALSYLMEQRMTAIWTVVPWDIIALAYLIFRGLNACVQANEFLFDKASLSLLDWSDEVNNPEATFETGREKAIGWIWDPQANPPQAKKLEFHGVLQEPKPHELTQLLELSIRRIEKLEEKQKILGLEVTVSLRNRLAASLGSVLIAMASKVPELLRSHSGHLEQAWVRAEHMASQIVGSPDGMSNQTTIHH